MCEILFTYYKKVPEKEELVTFMYNYIQVVDIDVTKSED